MQGLNSAGLRGVVGWGRRSGCRTGRWSWAGALMISMSSLPHHLSGSRLARRYSRRVLMLSVRSLACRTGTQELRVSEEMRRISSRAYCGRTRARVSRLEAPPGPVPARRRRRRQPRCQRRDRRHRGRRRRRWWPWCHQTAGGGGGCIARRRAWRASQLAAGSIGMTRNEPHVAQSAA